MRLIIAVGVGSSFSSSLLKSEHEPASQSSVTTMALLLWGRANEKRDIVRGVVDAAALAISAAAAAAAISFFGGGGGGRIG